MSLETDGLVLGHGTVLAPAAPDGLGARRLQLDGAEARLLALLSVAYGYGVSASVLDHIRRASREWSRGEECRAALHLVFAGLPKLDDPREAARRLFLADGLIEAGIAPRDVMRAIGLESGSVADFTKLYNENETRVPAGNGRVSGRWTAGEFLEGLAEGEVRSLARFAARLAGPVVALGMLFIPDHGLGRTVEGEIDGDGDLHADFARELFKGKEGLERIRVDWTPWSEDME